MTKKDLLYNYYSLLLVLCPMLFVYSLGGVNLVYLLFFAGLIFSFWLTNFRYSLSVGNGLYYFFIYMILISPLAYGITYLQAGNFFQIGTCYFLLCVIMYLNFVKKELVLRYYLMIAIFSLIFFYFQELYFGILGGRISGIIPFLEFSYYNDVSNEDMQNFQENTNRSSSFFLEPALYAQFLLPALIYNMKYKMKNIVYVCCIMFAFILLRSGVGLIVSVFCMVVFLYHIPFKTQFRRYSFIIFSYLFFSLALLWITQTNYVVELTNRASEFDSGNYESSGFVRILRGYYLFSDLPLISKIFGVGTTNLSDVIQKSSFAFMFGDNEVYLNGIQAILIGGGGIGLFLFLLMIYRLYTKVDFTGKMILASFLIISFMASSYLSVIMLLYIVLALQFKK